MRIGLGFLIGAAIALTFLSGCDDRDSAKKNAAAEKHTATGAPRLGVGWRQTAQARISVWGFAAGPDPVEEIRKALFSNVLPPKEDVHLAALINRFSTSLPKPASYEAAFRPTIVLTTAPWNDDTLLLFVGVSSVSAEMPRDLASTPTQPAITVDFDPKTVAAYRPLGDAAALPLQDGGTQTALMLYELSPLYNTLPQPGTHYGTLRIHYRTAEDSSVQNINREIDEADFIPRLDDALPVVRFSAAVAGFGGLLAADPAVRDLSCHEVIEEAQAAAAPDPDDAHAGLIGLMQLAAPLIDLPPPDDDTQ